MFLFMDVVQTMLLRLRAFSESFLADSMVSEHRWVRPMDHGSRKSRSRLGRTKLMQKHRNLEAPSRSLPSSRRVWRTQRSFLPY